MSLQLHLDRSTAQAAREHLEQGHDRLGFFLADVDGRVFTLREWRSIADHELEAVPGGHAVLTDDASAGIIRWAHEHGAALVEAHSHGQYAPAAFSTIDIAGLAEWVPAVRWRLRGAPYAAIVTAGDTVDAWAWTGTASDPEQVDCLVIGGTNIVRTTRATWEVRHGHPGI